MNAHRLIGLCLLLVIGWAPKASAHELDLALLSIHQLNEYDYTVLWKTTNTSQGAQISVPVFPQHCSSKTEPTLESSSSHTIQRTSHFKSPSSFWDILYQRTRQSFRRPMV